MIEIRIQEDIFREYPTFRRGIVVVRNAHNMVTKPVSPKKHKRSL
jgi:hypothetical protein